MYQNSVLHNTKIQQQNTGIVVAISHQNMAVAPSRPAQPHTPPQQGVIAAKHLSVLLYVSQNSYCNAIITNSPCATTPASILLVQCIPVYFLHGLKNKLVSMYMVGGRDWCKVRWWPQRRWQGCLHHGGQISRGSRSHPCAPSSAHRRGAAHASLPIADSHGEGGCRLSAI